MSPEVQCTGMLMLFTGTFSVVLTTFVSSCLSPSYGMACDTDRNCNGVYYVAS